MARKQEKKPQRAQKEKSAAFALPSETKQAIFAVLLIIVGLFLIFAAFGAAGVAGTDAYKFFQTVLGVGYFLLPLLFFILAGNTLREESSGITPFKLIASGVFILTGLGFVDIVSKNGGIIGGGIARPTLHLFDIYVSLIILGGMSLISLLILVEGKISTTPFVAIGNAFAYIVRSIGGLFRRKEVGEGESDIDALLPSDSDEEDVVDEDLAEDEAPEAIRVQEQKKQDTRAASAAALQAKQSADALKSLLGEYSPPPLSLLERDKGRPGVGDIKANANIIKRTLANFGIVVELDEISIGPSVTRYAIKPAEGVRLQKIVSLQTNLELALAAHPVRIEAPIPGKSLVGIEVPNSSKVTVGLGTLLEAPEFAESSKPLLVALGRDIAGGSQFGNIAKMPHALIAGATGSGKSVTIHAVINSLLYRCGPQQLRFLMIDPKRVELTLYNNIPHLLTPVITDAKKAIMALRWATKEMERRYEILQQERVRDIDSYHQTVLKPALESLRKRGGDVEEGAKVPEGMPYIVVIIDELADLMQSFPRELEAVIVRLAQMSRAVGIHLILSTQRPSVNVITGLIKANIPARVALQVASQIDSRTILDRAGAEKLLGSGDMLYLDGKDPIRLQSAYISEAEVKRVTDYIAQHNDAELPIDIGGTSNNPLPSGGSFSGDMDEEVDDDMYEAARQAVTEAGKASTSYIQRKLRVGYARAARLMDILEERGVIGPADGAKPREILDKGAGGTSAPTEEDHPL